MHGSDFAGRGQTRTWPDSCRRACWRPGSSSGLMPPRARTAVKGTGRFWCPSGADAILTKHNIGQLTALVKSRLKRVQHQARPLDGFLAKTGFDLAVCNPPPLMICGVFT
jgi:hypothetical protein